jgi:hypothetical protein
MSTISHIPNPVSVSVKTALYTIPSDRYARVTVNVIGSATFTINAVTALSGTQNNVLASSTMQTGANNAGTLSVGGNGTAGNTAAYGVIADQKNLSETYYLPGGTVINGTGVWRAVVEEYLG